LALGDLEDRLKKASVKLLDFKNREIKRGNLLQEIDNEIENRHAFSKELNEKDKLLRSRLLRNSELKSALRNLAELAGYKLNDKNFAESSSDTFQDMKEINPLEIVVNLTDISNNNDKKNNSAYTRHIQMAYNEIQSIMINDKQTLIDVVRKIKTNENKLKELEMLKIKVNASLVKINSYESNLRRIIAHDSQIANSVKQLDEELNRNPIVGFDYKESDKDDDKLAS
jgi:hypothetical protein